MAALEGDNAVGLRLAHALRPRRPAGAILQGPRVCLFGRRGGISPLRPPQILTAALPLPAAQRLQGALPGGLAAFLQRTAEDAAGAQGGLPPVARPNRGKLGRFSQPIRDLLSQLPRLQGHLALAHPKGL